MISIEIDKTIKMIKIDKTHKIKNYDCLTSNFC